MIKGKWVGRKWIGLLSGVAACAAPVFGMEGVALAADPPRYDTGPSSEVVSYRWTGPYVGLLAGYGKVASEWDDGTDQANVDLDGLYGGVLAGYSHQFNRIVIGIEGDIGITGWSGSELCDPVLGYDCDGDIEWFGTLRGRLGVAFDHALIYATGGLAFAELDPTVPGPTTFTADSTVHTGWTVGGGIEYALTPTLTARAEALYYDLGEEDYRFNDGATIIDADIDLDGYLVRAGFALTFPPRN